MLGKLLARLLGRSPAEADASRDFATLNRCAPVRSPAAQAAGADADAPPAYLCRETVLGRDQRVAGYRFLLHEGTRNRMRSRNRHIQHVYAELLVRNVAQLDLARLLGHRCAFVELPDSFLGHPCLAELPPANTVVELAPLDDGASPLPEGVLARLRQLRAAGYRVAIPASAKSLLAEADLVVVPVPAIDPTELKALAERLSGAEGGASLVARDLPSLEDFRLCYALGAAHFDGPFITAREDWRGNRLGPNTARLAELLARLRRDADTRELVALLKQDAALSLRLMRYINSAAVALHEPVASIERALLQLGRDRLYRWLMLLLYAADNGSARTPAVLENALVRARLMELLGDDRNAAERDALFLVGLLSLVDVILQVPMDEALGPLAPAPEIVAAVARGEGEMADLLRVVVACERGDPQALELAARHCGITPEMANWRHLDAFTWALELDA